eukprot:9853003-Alexandrium_andersonii.AAC.1
MPPRADDVPLSSPQMEQHRDEDAGGVDAIGGEDTPDDHLPRPPEPVRQHGGPLPSGHAPILHPGELG